MSDAKKLLFTGDGSGTAMTHDEFYAHMGWEHRNCGCPLAPKLEDDGEVTPSAAPKARIDAGEDLDEETRKRMDSAFGEEDYD